MRILIIEDEPFAQAELKRLLASVSSEAKIIGTIDSVEKSIDWFQQNPEPDLVFLDIQLSDGLSFEIFEHVKFKCPVIFTTAFDEYAIKAFKLNSIDYLLKPIRKEALQQALDKFAEMKTMYKDAPSFSISPEQVHQLLNFRQPSYKSRFVARVGDTIRHISVDDIAYFFAEDNVVFLVAKSGSKQIIEYNLEDLTKVLDPARFFRLNRSYIVDIDSVVKVSKYFNSRLAIELKPPVKDQILVSRVKVPDFIKWMDA
ncbi:MAG: LytTR family DNA-binding domain-containing protein [Bacteroidales bacterium]|nr:LytTR family DNA-binding domain-containing protein [Bacteroidales bacterium]MCF8457901.1 LytTR family DNA-binding domain-containing protein [Bacteroidales bacterium]